MDRNLTIPVTAAAREIVNEGAVAAGMAMATWARPILLKAAKREIAKSKSARADK
jgi:hypothetical protein